MLSVFPPAHFAVQSAPMQLPTRQRPVPHFGIRLGKDRTIQAYQNYLQKHPKRFAPLGAEEESELLARLRVKNNDAVARKRLYEGTLHLVPPMAIRYCMAGQEHWELLQAGNLKLHKVIYEKLDPHKHHNVTGLAATSLKRFFLDRIRVDGYRMRRVKSEGGTFCRRVDDMALTPDAIVIADERRHQIHSAIAYLSPGDRRMIEAILGQEKPEELAAALKINEAALYMRMSRARKRLGQILITHFNIHAAQDSD